MIIEKKEVNPNTYEEINITIKIEYPNIEYNDWKRTKEFNTDNDICSILDKILTNLNCKRVYEGKRVIMTTYPVYQMFINEYYYYLIKIANQFIYNPDDLSSEDRETLDIAISWSLIKKKKDTQRLSAGISKEGDIYTINKIFAPIFNISYRTRGGVNVHFSAEEIGEMLKGQFQKSKLSTSTKRKRISPTKDIKNIPSADQLSFFDWGEGK